MSNMIPLDTDKWEFVNSNFNNDCSERYYFIVKQKNNGHGTLVVFMMNPSNAGSIVVNNIRQEDSSASDKTINLILGDPNLGEKYKEVIILNNNPIIESNSGKLNSDLEALNRNFEVIKEHFRRPFMFENTEEYDLFVGTGKKGAGISNPNVYSSYCKNMYFLTNSEKCQTILSYGLLCKAKDDVDYRGNASKHPSYHRSNNNLQEVYWDGTTLYSSENCEQC